MRLRESSIVTFVTLPETTVTSNKLYSYYYTRKLASNYVKLYVIIPYYIEFNGPVMASMKIKTVQTILLSTMSPLPMYTPHHEPSPHRRCQDPLDRTRRSLHRHRCRRRPPSPSLSATAAIVTIMGVGCCFVPSAATVILTIVVQRRHNPTNEGITAAAASPPFSSPPAIPPLPVALFLPSPPSQLPMAPSLTGMQRRRPPVRRGECRSRPCPPCRKTGQLCQRRRHGRLDASVSSPAARVGPSFTSRAAAAGRATATAA
jgi:hypothetical protein